MKTLLRFAFLILCLVGLAGVAQGQVLVSGRVINGADEPIPGLSVYLIDETGQPLPLEDATNITDDEGRFTIADVVLGGWYTLEIYSGKALQFTDYVSIDPEDVSEQNTLELPDFIVGY
jgi:hypothetical protein